MDQLECALSAFPSGNGDGDDVDGDTGSLCSADDSFTDIEDARDEKRCASADSSSAPDARGSSAGVISIGDPVTSSRHPDHEKCGLFDIWGSR